MTVAAAAIDVRRRRVPSGPELRWFAVVAVFYGISPGEVVAVWRLAGWDGASSDVVRRRVLAVLNGERPRFGRGHVRPRIY